MFFIRKLIQDIENKLSSLKSFNDKNEKILNQFKTAEENINSNWYKISQLKEKELNLKKIFAEKEKSLQSEHLNYKTKIENKISQLNEKELNLENILAEKEKSLESEYLNKKIKLENKIKTRELLLEEKISRFKNIYDDTFSTITWLSESYADYYFLIDKKFISKYDSKYNCTQAQKKFANENKILRLRNQQLELKIKYLEYLIPNVNELIESNIEEIQDNTFEDISVENIENINKLVKIEDQLNKSRTEILQLALERYIHKKKSNFSIGKEYERYIGYLYEKNGYIVEYHGIKNGFDDLGIDLICKKEEEVLLIQCKNWSKSKNIYENAINQLFGTSIKYYIDCNIKFQNTFQGSLFENIKIPFNKNFQPIFITTTKLTPRAQEFAKILQIKIIEIPFDNNYPRIKCNNGIDDCGNKTKIYHLPFDQMYDRVQNIKNGGFYASTIEEAENAGYRKAFRWHGE